METEILELLRNIPLLKEEGVFSKHKFRLLDSKFSYSNGLYWIKGSKVSDVHYLVSFEEVLAELSKEHMILVLFHLPDLQDLPDPFKIKKTIK